MEVHLVRVITDDRNCKLWVAARPRDEAVDHVLNAIPEGWSAALLQGGLSAHEMLVLNLQPGEIREITSRTN